MDNEIKERFMNAGAAAFIIKSDFERGMLVSTVKDLINKGINK